MPRRVTLTIRNVDPDLLRRQIGDLHRLLHHLYTGEPDEHAEDWPDTLEGLDAMLGARTETP